MISGRAIAAALGGKWRHHQAMVCCVAHKETNPSLHISETDDGRVLVHCFVGCQGKAIIDILKSRGLWDSGNGAEFVPRPRKANGNGQARQAKPEPIMPLPAYAAPATFDHPKHGAPSTIWTYLSATGQTLGHICRFDTIDGKEILPRVFTSSGWLWQGFAKPRPLYGLDRLAARPDAPVLIVEGEKAADAAAQLCPYHVVITWSGGANAVDHADWGPLAGRACLLWPDADEPGTKAMVRAAAHAKRAGALEATRLTPPQSATKGWDAADALAEGWDWPRVQAWFSPPPAVVDDYEPTQSHVEKWLNWGLDLNDKGAAITNMNNVALILERDPKLRKSIRFDEFHQRIFTGEPAHEWGDSDLHNLQRYIQASVGIKRMSADAINAAVIAVAFMNACNEVRDWFDSLMWDGIERISHFFPDYFGTLETPYSTAVSRNFWLSMAARVYKPGCKVDNMVILEGKQGAGKSHALHIIGGDWYAEQNTSVRDPQKFAENIQGKLIMEIGEMDSFHGAEMTRVKQTVTCTSDRYRDSYGRYSRDHPRRGIFAGTTNADDWNRDPTGARRFWPVKCLGAINLQGIATARAQCFAEAVTAFKAGEKWWLMPEAETEQEQRDRYIEDAWDEKIDTYVSSRSLVTTSEVIDAIGLSLGQRKIGDMMRVGRRLIFLGWERTTTRLSGIPTKAYKKGGNIA